MLKLHLVGCIYVIYLWSAVFSFIGLNRGIHIVQRAIRRQVTLSQKCSVTDRIIDISPTSDGSGSILKRLIRHGDVTIGSPLSKDNVAIQWRIFRTDGSLIHDSSTSSDEAKSAVSDNLKVEVSTTERKDKFVVEEEYFEFKIGAVPRQVITGWEHAVKTMYPGELSQFTISPEYAFGDTGALPLIQPNTTLVCELELIKITPALSRKFKSIGYNESIRDELMEQIQSGQSPVAPAVTHTRSNKDKRLDAQNSTHSRAPSTISGTTVGSPVGTAGDTDVNSPTISSVHNAQLREPGRGSDIIKEEGMEAKYFDPEKHKLDAKLQVSGTGKGYSWVENKHSLDIEIPVPASKKDRLKKGDLHIDIRYDISTMLY